MQRLSDAPRSDVDLVGRCLSREPGAWEELVERFGALVYGVVYAALRRAKVPPEVDRVEELFDAVFVAFLERDQRRLRQWHGRCSLASWVRLVASSVVVDQLRGLRLEQTRARASEPALLEQLPHLAPSPLDLLVRAQWLRQVGAALDALPGADRDLLLRLVVHEEPADRVAADLGVRLGALYTRKSRALQRLRTAMQDAAGDHGA